MNNQIPAQLDRIKLREFYDDDPIMASTVFEAFLEEMTAAMPDFDRLYDEGSLPEFRRLVHKIKPGFLYVGLTSLYEQLNLLEAACDQEAVLHNLQSEVDLIRRKIGAELPLVQNELEKIRSAQLS